MQLIPPASTIDIVGVLVGLLLIAAIVLAFSKHFKLPFTVMLVLVGIVTQEISNTAPAHIAQYFDYGISPNIILYVCLPTLIFESAFNLDARQLQKNIIQILTLAVPGLLLSTLLIGIIVSLITPLSFVTSLLLGAILSATDPVAVISIFKQLGVPKRLTVLVEGESLFNDATAFVTAKIIFGIMIAGIITSTQLAHGIEDFIIEFFGGIAVGTITAIVIGYILGKVESDPVIEISLTTILAYFTFILGQNYFHVSGAMATLSAGVVMSRWRYTKISPSVVHYLDSFWEYLSYVANAFIFLIIGLSINWHHMLNNIYPMLAVIFAMLVSRLVVIFGIVPILGKLPGIQPIDWRYQSILYWGGLRGAIALAVILSLGKFENSDQLVILVTGAVLFTLIVKGLTIDKLVHALGLDKTPLADRLAQTEAKVNAKKNAIAAIPELQEGGLFSAPIAQTLIENCEEELHTLEKQIKTLRKEEMNEHEEKTLLFLRCLAKEKSLFYDMFVKGHISERAQRLLNDNIEARSDALRFGEDANNIKHVHVKQHAFRAYLIRAAQKIPFAKPILWHLRRGEIGRQYGSYWSFYQGADHVLQYLSKTREAKSANPVVIDSVAKVFTVWKNSAREQLDSIAEHFPEFVNTLQTRLANRLVLSSEMNAIKTQEISGSIPPGVAENIMLDIQSQMRSIREKRATKINLDPHELLKKVAFFQDLSSDDFKKIADLLHSRITTADENIIRQGETGKSLYIIMRGVVRVTRQSNGQSKDLATLIAGDFFGEMALLLDEKRNATCRAVTPCALFELRKKDLDAVRASCPGIQAAMEAALKDRQSKA